MASGIKGMTVLVTGSAGGLGRAFALAFAGQGAGKIIIADINDAGMAETKAMVVALGSAASVHNVDVSTEENIQTFAAEVLAANDRLDVLINNAGLAYGEVSSGFVDIPMDRWLRYLSVNTVAPLRLAVALRPALAKAKGLIINQSSMASYTPATCYGVTKSALTAMTFGMAAQFAGDEIRAVAIAPGIMVTDASEGALSDATKARVLSTQAVKRRGTAEDIANLGVFFASEEGSFINNEIVLCDGGNMMRGFRA